MPSFGSRAHSIFRISICLVVCVLAAVETSSAIPPGPSVTYQFVGQCSDCSGTGVGLLTLQGYTLGTPLDVSNLVSFTYTSNLLNFTITPSGTYSYGLEGTLPASLPAAAAVTIWAYGAGASRNQDFSSRVNGAWCAGTGCVGDIGSSSTWGYPTAAVPTLSIAAFCALGLLLAGAGALLVRARRTARA